MNLAKLESLGKGGEHMINLGNLKSFRLRGCRNLWGYIFSKSIAQSLAQLEILEVSGSLRVEAVFEQCSDDGPVCLPKLATVRVSEIHSLPYVFPSYMIEGLPKLRKLKVNKSWSLKHVFISSNNEVDEKNEPDHCCRLRVLVLRHLYNLETFCRGKKFIVAPLLEDLQVDYCEKLGLFTLTLNNDLLPLDEEKKNDMPPQLKKLHLGQVGSNVPETEGQFVSSKVN